MRNEPEQMFVLYVSLKNDGTVLKFGFVAKNHLF